MSMAQSENFPSPDSHCVFFQQSHIFILLIFLLFETILIVLVPQPLIVKAQSQIVKQKLIVVNIFFENLSLRNPGEIIY
jgi:hypothetical protein